MSGSKPKTEKIITSRAGDPFRRALADRIHQVRRELGLSQNELARRLGRANNSAVSRLERAEAGAIALDVLAVLADLARQAGHSAEWLITGQDVAPNVSREMLMTALAQPLVDELLAKVGERPRAGASIEPVDGPFRLVGLYEPGYRVVDVDELPAGEDWRSGHVPVLGRLAAGEGIDTVEAESTPPGWAGRYLIYEGAPTTAFAVQVAGESMAPDYRDGDMIVADGARAVRSGVACVIVDREGERRPKLKRLRVRKGTALLESINPGHETARLPAGQVAAYAIIAHLPARVERQAR